MKITKQQLRQIIREQLAEAAGKIICPNCGHHNSAGVDKCSKCGHPRSKGNWKEAPMKEAVRASEQFSNSGYISLEDDPYERIEVTSDGRRITIDMDTFKAFLKKANLSEGALSESPVRVDANTYERIAQAREALGDDDFIMGLASRMKPEELNLALTRMFRDLELKIDGVQYF